MHLKAYAKINPVLNVTGILNNGYHGIDTLMQSVSLSDDIYISDAEGISIICEGVELEKNTAYRASVLFFEKLNIKPNVSIRIEKHIPSGAGLGGGSADAAAVLNLLNKKYGFPLTSDELLKIALKIGADVPFCVLGGTKRSEGIGEKLTNIEFNKKYFAVILKTATKPSTALMYKKLDEFKNYNHPDTVKFISAYVNGDFEGMKAEGGNSFTCLWSFDEIYNKLYQLGADYVGLTGSGPCIFALFNNKDAANECADKVKILADVFVCETVN